MKTYRYITLAALALTFAACSQDEDFAPQTDGDAVKINATIGILPQTRLAYGTDGTTTFASGDQIRVINQTRADAKKGKSDAKYQLGNWDSNEATADTWEPATETSYVVWNGTGTNTIYGVYPSTAEYATFTIPTDQSTDITAADWMTASYIGTRPANKTLNLAFKHLLTKVTVEVKTWNTEFPENNREIKNPKINSKCAGVKVSYGTGTGGADEYTPQGNSNGITPLKGGTDANPTYTTIIAPARYDAFEEFMTFKIGEDDLTVRTKEGVLTDGLQPGYHYTFSLTVGKEAATISSVNVTIWDQKDVEGGVAEATE